MVSVVITPDAKTALDALPVQAKALVTEVLERLAQSRSAAGLHIDADGLMRMTAENHVLVFRAHHGLTLVSIDDTRGGH